MRKNIKLNWCWIKPHHTTPKKFENAVLFLRFRLPSTLIRLENGARKRSSKRRYLKTTALRFSVEGKHFENRPFQKRWRHDNHVISLPQFSQTQIQNDRWLLRFQISPTKCGRKTFDVFSEWLTPFSNLSGVVWTGHECLQFQGSHSKLMLIYLSMLSRCGGTGWGGGRA